MRPRVALLVLGLALATACGGNDPSADPSGDASGSSDDPCALVTPQIVAEVFGAESATGTAGTARNCSFTIEGGVAPSVSVFHFGPADQWDGVRSGYEENRGGVTELPGIGVEAYMPNDVGPYEVVARTDDVIFAVSVQAGSEGPEIEAAVADLAQAIAGS